MYDRLVRRRHAPPWLVVPYAGLIPLILGLGLGACLVAIDDGLIARRQPVDARPDTADVAEPSDAGFDAPEAIDATVFISGQTSLGHVVVGDGKVAWATRERVLTCPANGCAGAPEIVIDPPTAALSGVLWSARGKVYDVEHSGSSWSLRGCPFGPCDGQISHYGAPSLAPVLGGSPFVTDGTESFVIVDSQDIERCTNASCTFRKLLGPVTGVVSFGLTATKLFWTQSGADGKVLWCMRSGCASPSTLREGLPNPRGLTISNDIVYWTNLDDGTVMSCPADGCGAAGPRVLATGQNAPSRLTIEGDRLFWINSGNDTIGTVASSGSEPPFTLAQGVPSAEELAVDEGHVFVSSPTTGSIYVIARPPSR